MPWALACHGRFGKAHGRANRDGLGPGWKFLSRAAKTLRFALHKPRGFAYTPPTYQITCGRGGIGRRAALRSLWGNTRGSSSLLDRTNLSLEIRLGSCFSAPFRRWDTMCLVVSGNHWGDGA